MRFLLALLAVLFSIGSANAAPATSSSNSSYASSSPSSSSSSGGLSTASSQPDLISFGLGYMDFDKSEPKTHSMDMRVDYRFGYSFLGNDTLSFHPFLGFEATTRDL